VPSTDETGQSSERLFRLYTEGSDGAAGRRWVMLVVGIFVAICLAACVIVLMRSGQYDDMVRRLQPYMSADTVVSELGQPKGRFRGTLPGLALLGETPELQALGVPAGAGMTMIYHAPGANGPLILVFADTGTPYIDSWCASPSDGGGFRSAFSFGSMAQGSPDAEFRFDPSKMVCHRVTD